MINTAQPALGQIVHYKLSQMDADLIGARRATAFYGNDVVAGDVFPAMVVRRWDGSDLVQLQVFLDGNDTYWATSRKQGDEESQWLYAATRGIAPQSIVDAVARIEAGIDEVLRPSE